MKVLKDLFYTESHEWVKVEGNKAYIGITDFAQHALGDIVFVELPEADTELSAGDSFAAVESVKAASDVFIPVDARITEVNEALVDEPELVNKDAYENWMIKFELLNKSQLEDLMQAGEYEDFCSKEA
jgi:glycine cleavage system H protein